MKSLGYDPTMERASGMPSQLIIGVHSDKDIKKERKFKTIKTIYSRDADPMRSRGTRIFEAIEIDPNGREKGSRVVLKDIWIDSDRIREGAILDALYNDAVDEDKHLVRQYFLTTVCHGDVLLAESNIVDDTECGLMRGLGLDYTKLFFLQRKGFVDTVVTTHRSASGPERLAQASRLVYIPYPVQKYAHKTHYRIVFKEKGITVDNVKTLPEVLGILSGIVTGTFSFVSFICRISLRGCSALQLLRRLGWVHRDVSVGNILSCNGQAKLSDFEFAKKVGDEKSCEKRTASLSFSHW
jgi:serine/threonine protein kinase